VNKEYNEHWKAVELLLEQGADIEPALLAMNPRPTLEPTTDAYANHSNNPHSVFMYLGILPSQTLVYRQGKGFPYMITEDRWEAEGEYVKKELWRARARVRTSKLSHPPQITVLTYCYDSLAIVLKKNPRQYILWQGEMLMLDCAGRNASRGVQASKSWFRLSQ